MTRLFVGLVFAVALLAAIAAPASAASVEQLIAPSSICPGQTKVAAAAAEQERTMLCMTNYARDRSKLAPIVTARSLSKAAEHKAADLIACDEFSHEACGREFTYWMAHFGYLGSGCWGAAENIAWGTGTVGSVGAIFRAWMHSAGHRENILGAYAQIGIGLRIGELEGHPGAHVWVQEFGTHDC